MSTWIRFNDGAIAHIKDVCLGSRTVHRFVENGNDYEHESTAIRRAIMLYRKRIYKTTRKPRHRRKVKRVRRLLPQTPITMPKIYTYTDEHGCVRHYVMDTGKKFKKIGSAIKNALRYAHEKRNVY